MTNKVVGFGEEVGHAAEVGMLSAIVRELALVEKEWEVGLAAELEFERGKASASVDGDVVGKADGVELPSQLSQLLLMKMVMAELRKRWKRSA